MRKQRRSTRSPSTGSSWSSPPFTITIRLSRRAAASGRQDAPSPRLFSLSPFFSPTTLDWIFHSTLYQADAHWISIHRGTAIPAVWYLPWSLCIESAISRIISRGILRIQWGIHTCYCDMRYLALEFKHWKSRYSRKQFSLYNSNYIIVISRVISYLPIL